MEQTRNYTTKKPGDTKCDPFWEMEDIRNVVHWFEDREEWDGYLITMFGLLLGRRISDTLTLKWSDFYEENGRRKEIINSVKEQKTGKTIQLALSGMIFEVIDKYTEHTHIAIMNHWDEYIFHHPSKDEWKRVDQKYFVDGKCIINNVDHTVEMWAKLRGNDWSDKRIREIEGGFEKQSKKRSKKYGVYDDMFEYIHYVIDRKDANKWHSDWYRSKLKRAADEVGVKSEVSTHTLRKSFAFWIYMMHQFDPNCGNFIQKLFGHETLLQTLDYMGVTKYRNKQYMEDHGRFIKDVMDGKGDEIVKNMPVISLKSDDFGKIIRMLTDDVDKYQKAIDMANELRTM